MGSSVIGKYGSVVLVTKQIAPEQCVAQYLPLDEEELDLWYVEDLYEEEFFNL